MRIIFILLLIFISANFAQVNFSTHLSQNQPAQLTFSSKSDKIQYPGDSNIDVTYYKLDIDVTYNENASNIVYLKGTTIIRAKALSNLSSVFFDFQSNMTINDLKVNGAEAVYTHNNNMITITLNSTVNNGEEFTAEITYEGVPDPTGIGVFSYDTGNDAIWTLSEPYGASFWWVCKDTPADKPDSTDIWLTTSTDLIPASNGRLEDIVDNGDGTHTYKWHESYPIASYLISLAIAPYETFEQYYHYSPTDSMQVIHFNYPQNHTQARIDAESETVNMLKVFSEMYGEYPFIKEKYGHAEISWAGGMEHQTLTSIGHFAVGTIAHELAHQWFGDMITCATWENIWLNEGFATYSAALYAEKAVGHDEFMGYVSANMNAAKSANGSIYVQDIMDMGQLFSSARTYSKASIVLHMLRGVIGDDNFFKTMYDYANDTKIKYGAAVTEDFQRVAETVSGMDLNWFFQQWIYGSNYPHYKVSYNFKNTDGVYTVPLTITQTQGSSNLFKMPIEIQAKYYDGTSESFIVWDSLETQSFTLNVKEEPFDISVDPNNWILHDTKYNFSDSTTSRDKGVLLINGIQWTDEIIQAYQNKAYWGDTEVRFWDLFDAPVDGYPSSLPIALGNGELSSRVFDKFSTLIWVSSRNDLSNFDKNVIKQYLENGGNIIFISKNGIYYTDQELLDYIGIEWSSPMRNDIADFQGVTGNLTDISFNSPQELVNTFNTQLTNSNAELLYESSVDGGGTVGTGVIGGENGKFVLLAGQAEYFDYAQLSQNIQTILDEYLDEPATSIDNKEELPTNFVVKGVYPNPFNPSTKIEFYNNRPQEINITIYNLLGQRVATLANHKQFTEGSHIVTWNAGNYSSGVYFVKVNAGSYNNIKKIVLMK